jgi:hypothetical protein
VHFDPALVLTLIEEFEPALTGVIIDSTAACSGAFGFGLDGFISP